MKSKIYKFSPTIYPYSLYVSTEFNNSEIQDRFDFVLNNSETREIKDEELSRTLTSVALSLPVVDKKLETMGFLILFHRVDKEVSCGTVAHEAFHIDMFNNCLLNIEPPTTDNDEPQAYFIQWVVDCVTSVLVGNVEKMKGELLKDD